MRSLLSLLFLLLSLPLAAQQQSAVDSLFTRFKHAASFDFNFPREKVYVHLDNTAYFEGETLWLKAYVVRAAGLTPKPLSRVLYVEMLNAAGHTMDRKLLKIDSLGQAEGQFDLKDYYKSGFYELRAFTREMLNWGEGACFSRVIPIVERPVAENKPLTLAQISQEGVKIDRPHDATDLPENYARPFAFGTERRRFVQLFPEGGNRAAGLTQRMAFRIVDGRGTPVADTLRLLNAEGQEVLRAASEHEGMGLFTLPAEATSEWRVAVKDKKTELPAPDPSQRCVMTTAVEPDGLVVTVDGGQWRSPLLGLAVMCREQMCFFDTLSLDGSAPVEYFLPKERLRGGVNRLELFTPNGRSLATRLVWRDDHLPRLQLSVRQNKEEYAEFEPIALDLRLTDAKGQAVPNASFSLAVRDADADLAANAAGGAAAQLLLSSEVRGYIRHPEQYFAPTPGAAAALDLLLMVQGWTANRFETLAGVDSFSVSEPIEERLVLNGRVLELGEKQKPRPNFPLKLIMYNKQGDVLRAETTTDATGHFAFASAVDFTDDNWLATFITRNEEGKKRWSAIALNRWFAPAIRPFDARELLLEPPYPTAEQQTAALTVEKEELFQWRDTLSHAVQTQLGEATITAKNLRRYKGFTGNRLTYNGGEKMGLRHALVYYNFVREVERYKDAGHEPGTFSWFMNHLLHTPYAANYGMPGESAPMLSLPDYTVGASTTSPDASTSRGAGIDDAEGLDAQGGAHMDDPTLSNPPILYHGRSIKTLLNNDAAQAQLLLGDMMADEVKSVMITEHDGATMYIYEIPDYDRYKSKRGVERRRISGFAEPRKFFAPDYRDTPPSAADVRRTLFWAPTLRTDASGHASAVFFNNARSATRLRISAQGVTPQGIVDAER